MNLYAVAIKDENATTWIEFYHGEDREHAMEQAENAHVDNRDIPCSIEACALVIPPIREVGNEHASTDRHASD